MTRKFAGQQDYAICKLEALWWLDPEQADWSKVPKDQWNWTLMILTPDFVGQDDLDKAIQVMLDRGKEPQVREVRLESMAEGQCVQMLHVGPYDQVGKTVCVMAHSQSPQGWLPKPPLPRFRAASGSNQASRHLALPTPTSYWPSVSNPRSVRCQQPQVSTKRLFKGVSNVKSATTALFQVKTMTRSRVRLFMAGQTKTGHRWTR